MASEHFVETKKSLSNQENKTSLSPKTKEQV